MSRATPFRLADMLANARFAADHGRDLTIDALEGDVQSLYALLYALQIVGEAAARIPEEERDLYPKLPWRRMIGLRNIIVHQYPDILVPLIVSIIERDLPPLIAELERMMAEPEEPS